jgi:nucleoside phosphorylase
VGGVVSGDLRVEAMEGFGVLRACEQTGIPAIEIRAISNDLGESDRARWRIGRALESLADALPRVLEAAAE